MPLPIRPRQRYREVVRGVSANEIRIESVEDNNVHGFSFPEDAPGAVAAGTWSPAQIDAMTLIADPEWPTFRLSFSGDMDDENLQRALVQVGMFDGGRGSTAIPGGLGPGECYWLVVARSEDEAIERLTVAAGPLVDPSTIRVLSTTRP